MYYKMIIFEILSLQIDFFISFKENGVLNHDFHFHFIAAIYVYVTAPGLKAAVKQGDKLGYYEPLEAKTNEFPAWKQLSTRESFLYRHTSRRGYLGNVLGSNIHNIHSKTIADSPFDVNLKWKYYNGSAKAWFDDESLKISTIDGFLGMLDNFI